MVRSDVKSQKDIERFVGQTEVGTHAEVDRLVLDEILQAHLDFRQTQHPKPRVPIWRIIMANRRTRLAAAATIILVITLCITLLDRMATPAWALEQAIEALKGFRAVHMVGSFPGSTAEIWMRCNQKGTQSTDVIVRWISGAVTWVKDGSTYHYEPGQNTVYSEPAVTAGASPWLGPDLLDVLGKAKGADLMQGKDPATGRGRVTLISSFHDVHGPKSFVVEFDAETKLPVSLKQWPNLDRNGPVAFEAFKITYYKELSDQLFEVHIPGNVAHVEKPLTIPDENVGPLSDPDDGISTEGLSQQEACERIVRASFQAVIEGDLMQLKRLCPLCKSWGEEALRSLVLRAGKDDQITEIVGIGRIFKTGQSRLGPIVAVPAIVQCKDGTKVEEKMVVQFRSIGGKSSCVVHGPYGLHREIE